MRVAIVTTTIRTPVLLREYTDNLEKFGHRDAGFIVAGDYKTPHEETHRLIQEIKGRGFDAQYWDPEVQKKWLARFPKLDAMIPWNSLNRRNIAYLAAVEQGAEIIITIDDDNFVGDTERDFVGAHSIVGRHVEDMKTVNAEKGWWNNAILMDLEPPVDVYARGYPTAWRHIQNGASFGRESGRVVCNQGMFMEEPDLDAVTRLAVHVRSRGLKEDESVMLGIGTYSPINIQNTAVHRDAMACFYAVLMNVHIDGLMMDRYDDIWAGLFLKKAADAMGDRVTYGQPLARHDRNVHDLLADLSQELWGMIITERLVPEVMSWKLTSHSYVELYREMAEQLRRTTLSEHKAVQEYIQRLAGCMETWVETYEAVVH